MWQWCMRRWQSVGPRDVVTDALLAAPDAFMVGATVTDGTPFVGSVASLCLDHDNCLTRSESDENKNKLSHDYARNE